MRTIRSAALLGLLGLLAIGVFAQEDAPGDRAAAQQPTLAWEGCGGQFECATLPVPLDYAQPAGRQIDIRLIRLPALDREERIGSLLTNPGGPGGSGIDFLLAWARGVSSDIRNRFDLVSFDPRGVGQSTPLLCHDDIQRLLALDPEPATDDEWAEVRSELRQFADLCASRGGDLLPHLGSNDVVRDMDRIREALGEDKLTYVGYSYGTALGALYADEFPEHVRAMVLDGPVDLSLSPDQLSLTQAAGFERALDHFIEDCRERQCSLARDGRDPASAIDELRVRVRQAPIPAPGADRPAGPGETLTGIVAALYRQAFWPSLANAIQQALDGDGTWLVQLTDGLWGRQGNDYENLFEANTAVNCLDYGYSRDLAHYQALAREAAVLSPRFGASAATTGLVCSLWPVASQPLVVPHATRAPPLLIVGTTGDPATPYEWALATRRDLASSVLLTHEGEGHTAYVGGNQCVDSVVNAYLLILALPEDGAICGVEAAPRAPATPPAAAFPPRSAASPAPSSIATPRSATVADADEDTQGEGATGVIASALIAAIGFAIVGGVVLLIWRSRGPDE